MHKRILMLLLVVFWAVPTFAQDILWSRTYRGSDMDEGWSVQQTADGGYIVAGYSFGGDVYLIKTDSLGDTLWSRNYGGHASDRGWSVQQTTDGGYIVAGRTGSFGAGDWDLYLIKTNASGDTLWTRTYGGSDWDEGFSVQQTTDGGYIVTGVTESFGAGGNDIYLIKINALGDTLWNRTFGGSGFDIGWSVQQTTDGGYIVAGYTSSFGGGGQDVYLIKTDSVGDTLWTRTYGGYANEVSHSVQQTTDGGYIVAGMAESFGAGSYDVYLIKTDSLGDTLWSRTYGGSSSDWGESVQQTTDGGYIVAGWTWSFGGGHNVYLIKTDSSGDTPWTRTYGGSDSDLCSSVQQTTDGGYIVAGYAYSFGAGYYYDIYVIKTDSTGDTLWSRAYGGDGHDHGVSVQQTTDGGYVVAGETNSFGAGSYDVMLTKLDSLGNTCIGEFVSSTVMSVSPTVTTPTTEVNSPPTIVTSPPTQVASPATEVDTVCWWVCGDVNGDGVVELGDIVYLINFLYRSGPAPDPLEAGDVNACDAVVELGDVVYLINYLFRNGPPPYCCPAW